MAEVSLLTGLNYLGIEKKKKKDTKKVKTNDEIILDSYKETPYHSKACKRMTKEYNDMYKKNTDSATYMLNSYYIPEDEDIMGAGTNYAADIEDSFLEQFELPKASNQKIKAGNEAKEGQNNINFVSRKWSNFTCEGDDMTLGVIDKNSKEFFHNNMHMDNRMRDIATYDYDYNRTLEKFTGIEEHYRPKREMAPLFKPERNNIVQDSQLTSMALERTQELVGIKRNGEKPFEPKQNAPVLALDENQELYAGGRDTTRIMPKTIDQLRRADNPRISYTAPTIPGKKGSKRPVMPNFEKRKATLVEEYRDVYGSSGLSKPKQEGDVVFHGSNNRAKTSTSIVKGKGGNYKAYDPRVAGQIKQSQKAIYKGVIGVASMPTKRSQINEKSINIEDNNRMYTNTEYFGQGNRNKGGTSLSKSEKIRGKHILERASDGHAHRGNVGNRAANYMEKINGKQVLERAPDGHAAANHGYHYADFDQKINGKQILDRAPDGHAHSRRGHKTELQDPVRNTMKQTTVSVPRQGYIAGHHAQTTELQDPVRNTMKQTTVSVPRQGYIAGHHAQTTELQDPVRNTMKQTTVSVPRSAFMSGYNAQTAPLQDDVRNTMKQVTSQFTYNAPISKSNNNAYMSTNVTAPTTIKELGEYKNYVVTPGSMHMNVNNPIDATNIEVPFATKQFGQYQDYMGNAGFESMTMDHQQWYNARQNVMRDNTMQGRAPTSSNVNAIPTIQNQGVTELANYQTYNYVGIPTYPGNPYTVPETQLNMYPYHGDNISNIPYDNDYVNDNYWSYDNQSQYTGGY